LDATAIVGAHAVVAGAFAEALHLATVVPLAGDLAGAGVLALTEDATRTGFLVTLHAAGARAVSARHRAIDVFGTFDASGARARLRAIERALFVVARRLGHAGSRRRRFRLLRVVARSAGVRIGLGTIRAGIVAWSATARGLARTARPCRACGPCGPCGFLGSRGACGPRRSRGPASACIRSGSAARFGASAGRGASRLHGRAAVGRGRAAGASHRALPGTTLDRRLPRALLAVVAGDEGKGEHPESEGERTEGPHHDQQRLRRRRETIARK